MNKNRKNAIIVGILILVAYAVLASAITDQKTIVMLCEAISGFAVIGIAVIMYPMFKSYAKEVSLSYIALKLLEGGIMVVAGMLFLYTDPSLFALRDPLYLAHTYIFIVSALLFYYLLYISKIIPRFISAWGIVAGFLLLIANLLELSGWSIPNIILAIGYAPIILNEVFLAVWLMVKGFDLKKEELVN